jgi:hypothetical protein
MKQLKKVGKFVMVVVLIAFAALIVSGPAAALYFAK